MEPLNGPGVVLARGLLAGILTGTGRALDPIVALEVAQALTDLMPATGFPVYPDRPPDVRDTADALDDARETLRAAVAAVGAHDPAAARQVTRALECVDAALAVLRP